MAPAPDDPRQRARLQAALSRGRGRGRLGSAARSAGRAVVLGVAGLLFPRQRAAMPAPGAVRKVLVVRTDERVGNQLLTTPLLRALKRGLPGAELHLLAPRQAAAILPPHVDRLWRWQKRDAFRAPHRLLTLLRALRRERFDVVVEASHWSAFSLTAVLLARLAGGRVTVGHDRGESARFLSHAVAHDPANGSEVPAKLELLAPLGLPPHGLALETGLGVDPAPARALLAATGLDGRPLAVLNPGARLADRRWPPEPYAEVARGLAARGLAVLVVWGPEEEPIAREIARLSGATLAPPTDLALLAGLMRAARLVVSNNSGPMHLSVAVGAPTVGVFFSGDSARWGHQVATFAAAEVRSPADHALVLGACDRLLATA
ncbi:MAG TPA: glycosyltransferase family 9 protein [Anaeromyxobacteraceae bacterium]|nr:glycosyltransferase family 9 protein [Anaeromyxobacteraceae bacterium]